MLYSFRDNNNGVTLSITTDGRVFVGSTAGDTVLGLTAEAASGIRDALETLFPVEDTVTVTTDETGAATSVDAPGA